MTWRGMISNPGTSAAAAAASSRPAASCGVRPSSSAPNTLVSLCTSTGLTSSSSSRISSKSSYLARVGAQVDIGEQPGQPDRAALGEAVQRIGVGLSQVERACPPVLVVQQRVPPAQVGQRLDPLLLGGPDELQTPTAIILGHATGLPGANASACVFPRRGDLSARSADAMKRGLASCGSRSITN